MMGLCIQLLRSVRETAWVKKSLERHCVWRNSLRYCFLVWIMGLLYLKYISEMWTKFISDYVNAINRKETISMNRHSRI